MEDVKRVRGLLKKMGFIEPLCYKPDIYTYLDIYSGTTKLSPCRYKSSRDCKLTQLCCVTKALK